jgi:rhodanese-related sulfurtransferase
LGKVYAQAIILAIIGLALALTDRSVRPVPGVESAGQAASAPAAAPATNASTNPKPADPPAVPPPVPAGTTKPDATPAVVPAPSADPKPSTGPVVVIPDLDVSKLPVKLELAQSYTLFTNGAAFLDGRKPEEFAAERVQGAINLRNEDVQSNSPAWREFFQNANLEDVHVVYCYGKDCHEADQLRDTLAAVGFKKVFVMTSSVEEWKAAGLPTE